MATLIPEDGTGLATANSFSSRQNILDILQPNRHASNWAALTTPEQQDDVLIYTTQLLVEDIARRGWRWRGDAIKATQALPVPRVGLYDREGVELASNAVPTAVKQAHAKLVEHVAAINVEGAATQPAEQSLTMGRLSVTYGANGVASTAPVVPDVFYAPILHLLDRVRVVLRA